MVLLEKIWGVFIGRNVNIDTHLTRVVILNWYEINAKSVLSLVQIIRINVFGVPLEYHWFDMVIMIFFYLLYLGTKILVGRESLCFLNVRVYITIYFRYWLGILYILNSYSQYDFNFLIMVHVFSIENKTYWFLNEIKLRKMFTYHQTNWYIFDI